jgi:hypothetical protein
MKELKKSVVKISNSIGIYSDLFLGKKFVHFIHIGKTGGNSIKGAFNCTSPYLNFKIRTNKGYRIICHPHRFTLKDVPVGQGAFLFIRDPLDRYVSGFCSRKRKGYPKNNIPWTEGEAIAFQTFSTPNKLAESLNSSDIKLKERGIKAMNEIQHVNSHLSRWYGGVEYFSKRVNDIVMIGRTEVMEKSFRFLKKKLGIKDIVSLPENKKDRHQAPGIIDRNMSERARQNIKIWYKEDYEFIDLVENMRNKIDYIS